MKVLSFLILTLISMPFAQGDLFDLSQDSTKVESNPSATASDTTIKAANALDTNAPVSVDTIAPPISEDSPDISAESSDLPPNYRGLDNNDRGRPVMNTPSASDSSAAILAAPAPDAKPALSPRSKKDLLGPVKVTKVNSINELQGRYKSPRKALFMSLILPGAGQLYVGGKWNNVRGGAYLATEALLIGLLYHYSVNLYDQQVSKYENFAKANYSIGKFEAEMYSLYKQIPDQDKKATFTSLYLLDRESFCQALYSDPNFGKCSSLPDATNHRNQFPENETLGASMNKLTVWNKEDLYRIIGGENFMLGWDDVTDVSTYATLELDSSNYVALGKSSARETYMDMRRRANDYANTQSYFLGGILLNHLISAVDATFAAYSHNKSLYQEKVSWMQNLRFESGFDFNSSLNTRVTARLAF